MSCHGCATKFGVLIREKGCSKCGFSYCAKCLKYKAVVLSQGSEEQSVCKECYVVLTGTAELTKAENYAPPAAFLKRLESLENPARPPITVYQRNSRLERLKSGLSQEDASIADRLQKLKEEREKVPAPTEEEILRRLAALKGEDPDQKVAIATKKTYFTLDIRSDEEKTDALIKQLLEEQIMTAKQINPEEMIARRLAKLRSQDSPKPAPDMAMGASSDTEFVQPNDVKSLLKAMEASLSAQKLPPEKKAQPDVDSSGSDEENEVNQLVEKMRAHLRKNSRKREEVEEVEEGKEEETSEEELPWCVICNEDAFVRCLGCDGDLYCSRCFPEMHREEQWTDHKTFPFRKNPTP